MVYPRKPRFFGRRCVSPLMRRPRRCNSFGRDSIHRGWSWSESGVVLAILTDKRVLPPAADFESRTYSSVIEAQYFDQPWSLNMPTGFGRPTPSCLPVGGRIPVVHDALIIALRLLPQPGYSAERDGSVSFIASQQVNGEADIAKLQYQLNQRLGTVHHPTVRAPVRTARGGNDEEVRRGVRPSNAAPRKKWLHEPLLYGMWLFPTAVSE
ncbi:hypothetical protein AWB75_03905 [Caballeronia catudaia]|uniref:Uncharacterized protein n=1 Tax=Caballeronia catudaia TaxID=1777136 RepID=A0A158BR63_9BURK|nr:hypothetical protein AWB75_03905 [Caballeronia catudaia]